MEVLALQEDRHEAHHRADSLASELASCQVQLHATLAEQDVKLATSQAQLQEVLAQQENTQLEVDQLRK